MISSHRHIQIAVPGCMPDRAMNSNWPTIASVYCRDDLQRSFDFSPQKWSGKMIRSLPHPDSAIR
jgi:hypothetical protein